MDSEIYYFIIFSKSLYLPIREFTVSVRRFCDSDHIYFHDMVLEQARKICDELNYSFDDVYIYERCYFKD